MRGDIKRRVSLFAVSSQLDIRHHKFLSIPTVSNGSTVPAPAPRATPPPWSLTSNDAGICSSTSSSSLSSAPSSILRGCDAGVFCLQGGASSFRAVSASAVVRAWEVDIGEIFAFGVFGVPYTTSPASPRRGARLFGNGGVLLSLESASSVARHGGDPLLPSASSSELSASCSVLLLPLLFANCDRYVLYRSRCASVSAGQSSRADRGSCSVTPVGAAKLASHVYDNACSAVRRRVGLELRRARINLLAVV